MYDNIYLDTAPIIYFLENNPHYALTVQQFILLNALNHSQFTTSVITNIEYLPKPLQENKEDLAWAYKRFHKILNIKCVDVSEDISLTAVELRVRYPHIKPLDSIHLATAIEVGCDAFLTNDQQLKQVAELNVVYLDELK